MNRKTVSAVMLTSLLMGMLTLAFNIQPVKAEPRTWTVDDDGPADFSSIQEAINSPLVADGDTIFAYSGTYYENVVVNKAVALIGENKATTVIDGKGAGVVVSLVERANVSGFMIRNGDYGVQVRTWAFSPIYTGHTIDSNIVADNRYGGIYLRGVGGNGITNNIVANNTLFGIHLHHAGNNTLVNNTIVNNGHGIDFYGNSNDNTLRNNNMTNNEYNFGLILRGETRDFIVGTPSRHGIVNDVDTSNKVNGKPIYYWVNRHDEQVPSNAGYVWLTGCSNITIKGLNLSNNLQGILLLWTNNTVVVNNNIISNVYGIYVGVVSSDNTIVGNTLKGNLNGIYLGDLSRFTTMRNNSISGGQMNFGMSPDLPLFMDKPSDLINDIDASNTVDGKPIVYWINEHNRQVPTNAGYVMLINSTNILIEGLNLSNNVQNVFLLASNNTVITNSSIINSIYGIDVRDYGWFDYDTKIYHRFYSFNTTVKGNILGDNGVGIRIRSDNSTISNNTLYRNPLGIYLMGTSNSTISRNLVVESDLPPRPPPELYIFYYPEGAWEHSRELMQLEIGGIIVGGAYNIVYGNTVMDSWLGISMADLIGHYMGIRCVIFHNNFINNTHQAWPADRPRNYWDNGYPSGGNYWSDYRGVDLYSGPFQNETGSDGIGDTAYVIGIVFMFPNQDNYPLMKPWMPPGLFVDLARRSSWPEHHHYDISKDEDSYQTFYAKVKNFGNQTTWVKALFNVTTDNGFSTIVESEPLLIAQGEITELSADFGPLTDHGIGKYHVSVACLYSHNKIVWAQGEKRKTFKFNVVP